MFGYAVAEARPVVTMCSRFQFKVTMGIYSVSVRRKLVSYFVTISQIDDETVSIGTTLALHLQRVLQLGVLFVFILEN